jgi:tripartite-type tricarboxylate transporter receptor subunit TctC
MAMPSWQNGRKQRHGWEDVMRLFWFLAWALALASPAAAQSDYPAKPIRVVVPFGPGGSSDVIARVLQAPLQQALGTTIVIENRAGAGSNLGSAAVARAEPDGYTLLLTTSALVANPALYRSLAYDPQKDLAPVADLANAPNVLVTRPANGIATLADVISLAKQNPDKLNYSSAGIGTTPHLAMELLKLKAGINITHIAYGGGGPATQALLTGTVELLCASMPNAQEQVKAGTMKALAVTSLTRWADLAEVPTFAELGYPDMNLDTGHFLLAPAGTPEGVVRVIAERVLATLARPEVKERLRQIGYAPVAGGPEVLKARMAKEIPLFKALVAGANIRPMD